MTLALMLTASVLQPVVGLITDRRPAPLALVVGMSVTLVGLLLLSFAHQYAMILAAAAMVGMGSAVFHPESARIARLASGGRYGLAQSIFQVGGNTGTTGTTGQGRSGTGGSGRQGGGPGTGGTSSGG